MEKMEINREMTAQEAAEWGKTLSFETVWAALQEVGRKQAEAAEQMKVVEQKQAEAAEQMKVVEQKQAEAAEQMKETDRKLSEQLTHLEKNIERVSNNVDGVNRSIGRWAEQMVAARLWEKFRALGYEFTKAAPNVYFIENGRKIAEADVFLENGDYVMAVETKTDLTQEDADDHLDRIKKIRLYMDSRNDKRILIGAVAGAIVSSNVCKYAQKKGLYVLAQSGDSVAVVEMQEGFKAKKWE